MFNGYGIEADCQSLSSFLITHLSYKPSVSSLIAFVTILKGGSSDSLLLNKAVNFRTAKERLKPPESKLSLSFRETAETLAQMAHIKGTVSILSSVQNGGLLWCDENLRQQLG
jgi:hypothetical protein